MKPLAIPISAATLDLRTTASTSSRLTHHPSSLSAPGTGHVCASPGTSPPKALCSDPSSHCITPSKRRPVCPPNTHSSGRVLHRLPLFRQWLSLKASMSEADLSGHRGFSFSLLLIMKKVVLLFSEAQMQLRVTNLFLLLPLP